LNVNRKSLDLIQDRAVKNYAEAKDLKPAGMDGFRQLSTNVLYLSPALLAAGNVDPTANALLDKISAHLVKTQKEDGHWVINHMGPLKPDQTYYYILNDKGDEYVPPLIDENDVTTLWALLALTAREHTGPLKDEVAKSRDKALKWLKENRPSDNLQGAMLRVLLAKRLGSAEEVQAAVQRVLDQQNLDGGWGQTRDLPSDATGTGQALVALTSAGLTAKDPVIAKAWTFLLNSQSPDGSWPVFERAKFRKNPKAQPDHKPKGSSSYVGTAWTVIGLARSLPPDPNEAVVRDARLNLKERAAEKPKALDLYGSTITDSDLQDLAGFEELQSLGLGRTKITDTGLKELARFKQLQSLDLSFNVNVTPAGLKNLPSLNELDFTFNAAMTDAFLKELDLPKLTKLNLQNTAVTDEGLKELARLPKLQVLILDGTAVTNAGLKHLENFKQLKVVHVRDAKATYPGVESLSKAIPGVKVHLWDD
jgi:hypothetical protein